MGHRAQGCLEHEDDTVTNDPEKIIEKLLKALQSVDPSWRFETYQVHVNPLDSRSPTVDTLSMFQGDRRFCRGFDVDGLLFDFVECCRDRQYSTGPGWRIPGVLLDATDLDDLVFRLEVLT